MLRLVVAHPQQLGKREAGQHGIRREGQDVVPPHGLVDPIHLALAALIAPDQRGADDVVVLVQDYQPVHLARQPQACDVGRLDLRFRDDGPNGLLGRVPPVLRALFGPQGALHLHVFVRRRDRGRHPAFFIHQKGPAAAGTDVDA
jgi:hypothetical protein